MSALEAELNDIKTRLSKSDSVYAATQEEIATLKASLEHAQSTKVAVEASASEKEHAVTELESQVSRLCTCMT